MEGGFSLIQRTQFNKISIDRIQEVFAGKFTSVIEPYLQQWREWIQAGGSEGRVFYISLNASFEVDGILFQDIAAEVATIFSFNATVARNLVEKATKYGQIATFNGDPTSCQWAKNLSTD